SIEAISITGDFFLHPEETLTEIEHALLGLPTKTTPLQFQSKIDQVLSRCDAQFIGLSSQDIAQTISEALYG
ncbi:MAG: lipoate--protein ligase family protein, partial [Candidatus Diapherotrites archaeon]|nr:lipoate--protein ligase family protein [Candidatus Diapherotrites archaeon]